MLCITAVEYTDGFFAEGYDSSNECPGYDTKQSDGEVSVMLELWGMRSIPSLPSLPVPLWPRVVVPDKGSIYGLYKIKSWVEFTGLACKLRIYAGLNCLK